MRNRLAVVVLFSLGCAGSIGCGSGEPEEDVPTASVMRGSLERIVVATGTLEPERLVDVRPRISGIVEKLHIADGDLVKEGQVLVEIDRELIEVRLREVRAELESAEIERHYAEVESQRAELLKQRGTMPDQDYDNARARKDRAEVAVTKGRAAVSRLEVELRHATVRAPMDGIVLDVPVEEGSAVSSVLSVTGGTPILTLASRDGLHLEGLVDENEIARVVVGQTAKIKTEAFGGDSIFAGVVRHISPIGKRVQNVTYFEVEVDVVDPNSEGLLPRMSADADIVTEIAQETLFVQETALHYDGDEIYLIRAGEGADDEPDEADRIVVELGIIEGDRVQLTSGATAGDVVRTR